MKIGISKSATCNCGNYNSMKVEYWEEREVDEKDYDKELKAMSDRIDTHIQNEIVELQESLKK